MISTRNNDDKLDVIDLTTSYGYYGSFNFPIRPPTPFTDNPAWPNISSQDIEDNSSNGIVTWSLPTNQSNFSYMTDNTKRHALSSSFSSLSSRMNNTLRRTLNKFLKRTKSNDHKKPVISSTTNNIPYPYNFGIGEINRTDSITSRNSTIKHVHWIDDNEIILNTCHRFIECLKLFVQNIIDDKNDDIYLKDCQILLDKLNTLIDCQQINEAFDDLIEFIKKQDKNQLIQQQIYIENLISRILLLPST